MERKTYVYTVGLANYVISYSGKSLDYILDLNYCLINYPKLKE